MGVTCRITYSINTNSPHLAGMARYFYKLTTPLLSFSLSALQEKHT